MSLLVLAAVTIVPIGHIDLGSPTVYVSQQARAAIADGHVATLACLELPERSRKFRTACLTSGEWDKAVKSAAVTRRGGRGPAYDFFPYQPVPQQSSPYQSGGAPR